MLNDKNNFNLKFNSNGKFKIMQISDIQDSLNVSKDTMKFINAALDEAKPDLVIFTGDQLKGYSSAFRGSQGEKNVKTVIDAIVEPLSKRNVPFAVAFGNHDLQCKLSTEKQLELYKNHNNFVSKCTTEVPGVSNCILPILSSDEKEIAFNIYIIDSHGSKGSGYETVSIEQIEWYRKERERLKEENNGKYVASFMFQHIPFEEMYYAFDEFNKKTKGALRAYRKRKGKYYALKKDFVNEQSFFGELPAVPDDNNGQFEAISEKGDIVGIFFGHDHKNCFIANYKGVDMGYCPGVGFAAYGPRFNRGIRVFELNENQPKKYTSHMLFYKDLIGTGVEKRLKQYLIDKSPSSVDLAIYQISRLLITLAVIVAIIISIYYLF